MAKLLKLRLGVSDDPTAFQPSLNDCLEAMLQQAEMLMTDVLNGLAAAAVPPGARRIAGFQQPGTQAGDRRAVGQRQGGMRHLQAELTRIVYEGGGKEQVHTEALRFEDLRLFEDSQLDQSIEVARAQQEVSHAVDDVLPALDALISTLLGWRTIQPGPQSAAARTCSCARCSPAWPSTCPTRTVREVLIAPAAGLLGVNLRKLYRELADWLLSCGVEPAVPLGGRVQQGGGASGAPVARLDGQDPADAGPPAQAAGRRLRCADAASGLPATRCRRRWRCCRT